MLELFINTRNYDSSSELAVLSGERPSEGMGLVKKRVKNLKLKTNPIELVLEQFLATLGHLLKYSTSVFSRPGRGSRSFLTVEKLNIVVRPRLHVKLKDGLLAGEFLRFLFGSAVRRTVLTGLRTSLVSSVVYIFTRFECS